MSRWPEIAGVRAFWPTPYREVPAELFDTSVAVAQRVDVVERELPRHELRDVRDDRVVLRGGRLVGVEVADRGDREGVLVEAGGVPAEDVAVHAARAALVQAAVAVDEEVVRDVGVLEALGEPGVQRAHLGGRLGGRVLRRRRRVVQERSLDRAGVDRAAVAHRLVGAPLRAGDDRRAERVAGRLGARRPAAGSPSRTSESAALGSTRVTRASVGTTPPGVSMRTWTPSAPGEVSSGSVPLRGARPAASSVPASGPWSTATSSDDQAPQAPFSRTRTCTTVPSGAAPSQSTPTRLNGAVAVSAVTTAGASGRGAAGRAGRGRGRGRRGAASAELPERRREPRRPPGRPSCADPRGRGRRARSG